MPVLRTHLKNICKFLQQLYMTHRGILMLMMITEAENRMVYYIIHVAWIIHILSFYVRLLYYLRSP